MKLTTKIQRQTLLFLPLYFILAVVITWIFVRAYMLENIEERMLFQKEIIIEQIANGEIPKFKGFIEVSCNDSILSEPDSFSTVTIYDQNEDEYIPFRVLTFNQTINNKNYQITLKQAIGETEQVITDLTKGLLIIFLLFIIINYLSTLKINNKVWLPFYNTLGKIKLYNLSQTEKLSLSESNINEFNDLNTSINKLTDRIRNDFLNLKAFTENASHEIQTPIAVIKTNIDLLIENEQMSEKQMEYITNIELYTTKLQKLNKALILLSKIENNQFPIKEYVDLKKLLIEQTELIQELFNYKNIQVKTDINTTKNIEINPTLAEILIHNLLKNAMYYTCENGLVEIKLTQQSVSISNTGEPLKISPDQLFQRFKKDNQSSKSLGLGLSIVKEICDQNQLKITYSFLNNYHIFEINF